ncbi:MAG: hypothetical protein SRB2_01009 [Desulfobacteraceae bacterium Eth-SRB2]|nr:MAG: hypothetical protein SRB2_01009 [Desulfobacteraceae bacterium Eth-SRB2]
MPLRQMQPGTLNASSGQSPALVLLLGALHETEVNIINLR